MTITLSLSEIRELVIQRYSLPADTLVDIAGVVRSMAADVEEFFTAMKPNLLPDGTINPCYKIAAIKQLRTVMQPKDVVSPTVLSLWKAKQTIENWSEFSQKIKENNKMPRIDNDQFMW